MRLPQTLTRRLSSTPKLFREIKLEKLGGNDTGIAVLSMDRPNARNALGKHMVFEVGGTSCSRTSYRLLNKENIIVSAGVGFIEI